jgi:hypothetical protein
LILCAAALVVAGAAGAARLGEGDFGDAPDGQPAGYFGSSVAGTFPSLHEHDGAHAHDTGAVWLGARADSESQAKLVDRDLSDDGVAVALRSCGTSTAYVAITVPSGGAGTAYVNLLFDWNRSGSWGANDRCAPEWAARNVAIDLSQQRERTRVYAIPFRGGVQTRNLWYRAIVSLDQRWTTDSGAGTIARGEVEDFKVGQPAAKRVRRKGKTVLLGAICTPSPLVIRRGGIGRILLDRPSGARTIGDVSLARGVAAKTRLRTLSVRGAVLTYRSTGGATRTIEEVVPLQITYRKLGTLVVRCGVRVLHQSVIRAEAVRSNCTLVGPPSTFAPLAGVGLRGRFRLPGQARSWARQCGGREDATVGAVEISGFGGAAPAGAILHLGDPTRRVPPARWGCAVTGPNSVRCAGSPELKTSQDYYFDVAFGGAVPDGLVQVHLVLFTPAGEIVGSVESGRAP